MFAVVHEGRLLYAGHSQSEALICCEANFGSKVVPYNSISELDKILESSKTPDLGQMFSDAFETLVQKLDDIGLNQDLANAVSDNTTKLVGELKTIGCKGMATVGEGFIALGELLRKNS